MQCPAGYGSEEVAKDEKRLNQLSMKRMTPPYNAVSEAEVTEEAHLEMRVRVYYWRRFKGLEIAKS